MKKVAYMFMLVGLGFVSSSFADHLTVNELVADLQNSVAHSRASDQGRAEINGIVNQCASESTTQSVCSCLTTKLPSRAHKLVTRCNNLIAN